MNIEMPPGKNFKTKEKTAENKKECDIIASFKSVCTLIILFLVAFVIFLMNDPFYPHNSQTDLSNLRKFNNIDLDLAAAGINIPKLQEQFKLDPLAYRVAVNHHKRKRFMIITHAHEKVFGEYFVNEMKRLDILCKDEKLLKRCNKILKRFTDVMPENFTPPEKIYILDTSEINACCLPDGTIVVFKGLVEKFDDEELAAVIGHELAHGIAHHSAEMISKAIIQMLAIKVFRENEKTKEYKLFKIVGSTIAAFLANLQYSRTQENEADRLALLYMKKAGFNTQGLINVIEDFNKNAGESSALWEYFSTHPHPKKRLENIKNAIADIEKNPDHVWGGLRIYLLEAAKVKAIEIYLEKQKQKQNNGKIMD